MKCFECDIPMKVNPCASSTDGKCREHRCPKCDKSIHSKRGSKQKTVEVERS